jgi:beta-phosphoglucomutase
MFPATLFDYNGVLADDEAVHLAAFRDALRPLGVEVAESAYWERYIGFDDVGAFRAILNDAGRTPTDAQIEELVEAKRPLYRARAEASLPTFPGAADIVLRRARSGPVGIVSGALRDEIELGLTVLCVRELVNEIISAEDTRQGKPDPEGYRLGIARLARTLGEDSKHALVIEDSLAGIQAAKAAGLTCVAVTHSYGEEELARAGADWIAPSLEAIDDTALAALYRRLHG